MKKILLTYLHQKIISPVQLRKKIASSIIILYLLNVSIIFLLPLYLLLRNSLSTQAEITSVHWEILPHHLQWKNFTALFTDPLLPFAHSLGNSLIISFAITLGVILLSAMAGFAFARSSSPVSHILWILVMGSLLLPATISFVPSYIMIASFGWIDSMHGIIIPSLFQAFAVLMYRQFFHNFPQSIEEAAYLDGLSSWKVLWTIIMPNALPITASLATLIFLQSWNAFLWPFIVAADPQSWTIQLSLSTFLSAQSSNFPELFAGTVISLIPSLLIFLGLSHYMIQGIELTTDK